MGVAKSSYYYELGKEDWAERYEHLHAELAALVEKHPGYGYRRLLVELKKKGFHLNHKVLRKLLKAWKLSLKRKVRAVQSGIAKLLDELGERVNLARQVVNPAAFSVVCCDITEIRYRAGKVFLAACLDLNTKRLVGWAAGCHPNAGLVIAAYQKARRYLKRMGIDLSSVIFHSDQGSVYTSYAYVSCLVKDLVKISYSRKGCPQDNPEVESFFGRLKEEWGELFADCETEREVIDLLKNKLLYYNGERIHSSLGYLTPDEFVAGELKIAAHA